MEKPKGKDEFVKACHLLPAVFETRPCYVAQARSPVLPPLQITGVRHTPGTLVASY